MFDAVDPADMPCACSQVRKAARAVSRLYDDALAGAGMTITQFALLRRLGRSGQQPLSRLAEQLVMDRTTLYRTLAPLERQGWILVCATAGRRAKTVGLTEEGAAALTDAIGAWESMQRTFLGRFDPERWRQFDTMIGDLVQAASRDGSS